MKLILALAFPLLLIFGSWFTPWSHPQGTITVSGQSKQQVSNQTAHFSVNVTQTNKDKQTAVESVNGAMDKIIEAVKDFGINEKDITTQNVSVNEVRRPEKQWQASNSLAITLRDVNKASALTDLLQGFPLAQVSGPSFSVDDSRQAETELLTQAVEDAREKAAQVAQASGRKLGKVLTVNEGNVSQPWPVREMAVSAPVEPGSSQMTKTVTVVFELK